MMEMFDAKEEDLNLNIFTRLDPFSNTCILHL
jgi:hypothetical protein